MKMRSVLLFFLFFVAAPIQSMQSGSSSSVSKLGNGKPSKYDINNFFDYLQKGNFNSALKKLYNNPALAVSSNATEIDSPLIIFLKKFDQSSKKDINDFPILARLITILIEENIGANVIDNMTGYRPSTIVDLINKYVKDKGKVASLVGIVDSSEQKIAKQNLHQQAISKNEFFALFSQGKSLELAQFLEKYPSWAIATHPKTGLNTLQLALKNYSGFPDDDKLIKLLIQQSPKLIFTQDGESIGAIVGTHVGFMKTLPKLIRDSYKQLKVEQHFIDKFNKALKNNSITNIKKLILEMPQIVVQDDVIDNMRKYLKERSDALPLNLFNEVSFLMGENTSLLDQAGRWVNSQSKVLSKTLAKIPTDFGGKQKKSYTEELEPRGSQSLLTERTQSLASGNGVDEVAEEAVEARGSQAVLSESDLMPTNGTGVDEVSESE